MEDFFLLAAAERETEIARLGVLDADVVDLLANVHEVADPDTDGLECDMEQRH